jgi:hypothetical protein
VEATEWPDFLIPAGRRKDTPSGFLIAPSATPKEFQDSKSSLIAETGRKKNESRKDAKNSMHLCLVASVIEPASEIALRSTAYISECGLTALLRNGDAGLAGRNLQRCGP